MTELTARPPRSRAGRSAHLRAVRVPHLDGAEVERADGLLDLREIARDDEGQRVGREALARRAREIVGPHRRDALAEAVAAFGRRQRRYGGL